MPNAVLLQPLLTCGFLQQGKSQGLVKTELVIKDSGDCLFVLFLVDGMQPSEESPLDFPAFQESELAKRRRNVIKRLTAAASDTGDIQLFCSHSWRGRDPKIQNRKFEVFSSLTTPDKEVSC